VPQKTNKKNTKQGRSWRPHRHTRTQRGGVAGATGAGGGSEEPAGRACAAVGNRHHHCGRRARAPRRRHSRPPGPRGPSDRRPPAARAASAGARRGRRPAGRRCWWRKAAAGGAAARRSAGAPAHTATDAGGGAAGRGRARQVAVCTGEPRQGLPSGVGGASPRKRAFAGVRHGSSFQRDAGECCGPHSTRLSLSEKMIEIYSCTITFYYTLGVRKNREYSAFLTSSSHTWLSKDIKMDDKLPISHV